MKALHRTVLSLLALAAPGIGQDVNVALGGTATQSSFAGFGEQASFAIDGDRDGYWWHYSSTCTANLPGAWWQVVLAAPSLVNEIVVVNRADCCGTRLSNFRVEVSLGASVVFTQDILSSGGSIANGGVLRVRIPGAGVSADRVRLSNRGPNAEFNSFLQFTEVEVIRFGAARQVNLARYGTASASSNNLNAARLVDGWTDGMLSNNRGIQTQNSPGSWVRVDVARRRLDRIRLWPVSYGQAGCGNFRVSIYDGAVEVFGQNLYAASPMPTDAPTLVTPPPGTDGDSVRVTSLGPASNGQQRIELAELEILHFASYTGENWEFGIGCRGSAGVPALTCSVRPELGANLHYRLTNAAATPGIAGQLIGLSNQFAGSAPLPVDCVVLGAPGCWIATSIDATLGAPVVANAADIQLLVPNDTGLLGLRMFTQGVVMDPAANAFGWVLSNAIEQYVGF